MPRLVYSQSTAWPRTPGSVRGTGKTGQTAQADKSLCRACISISFCCSAVANHEPRHGKTCFCKCKSKAAQISCPVTAQLISAFAFTTYRWYLLSIYFLNQIFQAPCHLFLISMVCVGPGRKPRRQVFS